MKNLTSLLIVAALLTVLGCKCQYDLFNKDNRGIEINVSNSPTPTPAMPQSSSTPYRTPEAATNSTPPSSSADANKFLKTGTYTGRGTNLTYNRSGDFLLRIDSVDAAGNVKAYFEASNGLNGSSTMTGKIDDEGKLTLDGEFADGRAFSISATVTGRKIEGGYGIADDQLNTESGNFTLIRR